MASRRIQVASHRYRKAEPVVQSSSEEELSSEEESDKVSSSTRSTRLPRSLPVEGLSAIYDVTPSLVTRRRLVERFSPSRSEHSYQSRTPETNVIHSTAQTDTQEATERYRSKPQGSAANELKLLPDDLGAFCALEADKYSSCVVFAHNKPYLWNSVELLPPIARRLLDLGDSNAAQRVISRYVMLSLSARQGLGFGDRIRWMADLANGKGTEEFANVCRRLQENLTKKVRDPNSQNREPRSTSLNTRDGASPRIASRPQTGRHAIEQPPVLSSSLATESDDASFNLLSGTIMHFASIPEDDFNQRAEFLTSFPEILRASLTELREEASFQVRIGRQDIARQCISCLLIIRLCETLIERPEQIDSRIALLSDRRSENYRKYRAKFDAELESITVKSRLTPRSESTSLKPQNSLNYIRDQSKFGIPAYTRKEKGNWTHRTIERSELHTVPQIERNLIDDTLVSESDMKVHIRNSKDHIESRMWTSSRMDLIAAISRRTSGDVRNLMMGGESATIDSPSLVGLFKDFAASLSLEILSRQAAVISTLMYEYAESISRAVKHSLTSDDVEARRPNHQIASRVSLEQEKPEKRAQAKGVAMTEQRTGGEIGDRGTSGKTIDSGVLDMLTDSTSYSSLIKAIVHSLLLTNAIPDLRSNIRNTILSTILGSTAVDLLSYRQQSTANFTVRLGADSFRPATRPKFLHMLAITGSMLDAQATTISDYINRVWPLTGSCTLRALLDCFTITTPSSRHIPFDLIKFTVNRQGSEASLKAEGTASMVAQVGEQLCWIASALNRSTAHKSSCSSSLRVLNRHSTSVTFDIETQISSEGQTNSPGSCWNGLFTRFAFVEGYPILRRPQLHLGLEMSLEIAAKILDTLYLQEFANKIFLKGVSSIVAPVKRVGNILVWHAKHDAVGKRISYNIFDPSEILSIGLQDIEQMRHIFGWCCDVKNSCGVKTDAFEIEGSDLERVPADHALEDYAIRFGKPLSKEPNSILMAHGTTVSSSRDTLLDIFRYIEKQSFLLWDTKECRGWLVNGMNVLLHVIRVSFAFDGREDQGNLFVLKPEDFEEPADLYDPAAPRQFLSNRQNLSVKIAVSDVVDGVTKYETLRDSLRVYFDVLEKCLDYQTRRSWESTPRHALGGWDFVALVRKDEPIDPTFTPIPGIGRSWIDFVRASGIVTLFGHVFGDLLTPKNDWCTRAPAGTFCVAVMIKDFKTILQANKCGRSRRPVLVSRNPQLNWYRPNGSMSVCACAPHSVTVGKSKEQENRKPIQVFWPQRHMALLPDSSEGFEIYDHDRGALIFGQPESLQCNIPDWGPPLPGKPPETQEELHKFEDSAIGSSITSSASHDSAVSPTIPSALTQNGGNHSYGPSSFQGGVTHLGDNYVNQFFGLNPHATADHQAPSAKACFQTDLVAADASQTEASMLMCDADRIRISRLRKFEGRHAPKTKDEPG